MRAPRTLSPFYDPAQRRTALLTEDAEALVSGWQNSTSRQASTSTSAGSSTSPRGHPNVEYLVQNPLNVSGYNYSSCSDYNSIPSCPRIPLKLTTSNGDLEFRFTVDPTVFQQRVQNSSSNPRYFHSLDTWGLNVQEPGEEKQDVKKTHRRFVYGSTRRDGSIRRETALFPLTQSGESGIRDMSLSRISSHVQIPRTITHTKFPRIQRTWNSKCSLTPVSRV
ncbi:hypothetical protein AAMO2058_000914500 [Amorphochlora amoebiformis]